MWALGSMHFYSWVHMTVCVLVHLHIQPYAVLPICVQEAPPCLCDTQGHTQRKQRSLLFGSRVHLVY